MDLPEQSDRIMAHFGLKFDPFGSLVDTMVFSGACGRYETVETVRHLLAYSQQDGLISGMAGSGKRMVAQQVIKLLEDEWRVCWIDGSDTETVEELFREIVGQLGLGLKLGGNSPDALNKIIDVCSMRSQSDEAFLILVQFADRLPVAIAELLMQIRQQAPTSDSRIRQLWLCTDLESLPIDVFDDDWYHHGLVAFDDAAAEQYLKDRFVAAGHIGDLPIPSKDIVRLNQMAKGLPSKLNELAADYLISATFRTTEKQQKFPITHVAAGLAAVALVVIAFLYQTSDGPEPVIEVSEASSAETTLVGQKLAEAVAKVEAKQLLEDSGTVSSEEANVDEVIESTSAVGENREQPSEVEVEAVQPIALVQTSTIVTLPETTASVSLGGFIATGANTDYTIQLIGVRDRSKLDPLIEKFSDRDSIDVLETTYQGQPWFVLFYGQFQTRALAEGASSSLPPEFTEQDLWIRTFASVRQDLN